MCSLEWYFGVYFPRCCATWEINTKITLSWVHKQFAMLVHTLFYIHIFIVYIPAITNNHTQSLPWELKNGQILDVNLVHVYNTTGQIRYQILTVNNYRPILPQVRYLISIANLLFVQLRIYFQAYFTNKEYTWRWDNNKFQLTLSWMTCDAVISQVWLASMFSLIKAKWRIYQPIN